ncbi:MULTISPECIES: hypothetical protein [unclassified Gordonia (in: high G+C Gram-positive bacteria)]|uniref:hypothetical protein n=1 Tax=unclassified Gordonia (in: high G+C Gram-positive bacteria) TaxID=2657482 RepID=UPI00071DE169|nr:MULTISPECIES: hypothetical protein [unclassified Gordonia (in: high G+C Gram-positive bacteria)]KSU59650.1 hypothetical protein AS181_06515 [Gordonia sp. SGD-V-85]SCC02772.1 hypothetical protein GA0061091_104211 [Gordonia sp. v-85]
MNPTNPDAALTAAQAVEAWDSDDHDRVLEILRVAEADGVLGDVTLALVVRLHRTITEYESGGDPRPEAKSFVTEQVRRWVFAAADVAARERDTPNRGDPE